MANDQVEQFIKERQIVAYHGTATTPLINNALTVDDVRALVATLIPEGYVVAPRKPMVFALGCLDANLESNNGSHPEFDYASTCSDMLHIVLESNPSPAEPSAAKASVLPDGWVPLTISWDGDPEEVAYGPQIMMDRLKKWLDRYYGFVLAERAASFADDGVKCKTCKDKKGVTNKVDGYVESTEPCPDCARALDAKCIPRLLPELSEAFYRVYECLESGDDYDVPRLHMQALAEYGVVRRVRGDLYEITSLGDWMHSHGLHCGHSRDCHKGDTGNE